MKNDVLNNMHDELKKVPYNVPDGYFEELRSRLQHPEAKVAGHNSFLKAMAPYASMAAAFALIVTVGTHILKSTSPPEDMTFEDYLVHSDYMVSNGYENDINVINSEIEDEDIVDYLIYTGVTAELIELSK